MEGFTCGASSVPPVQVPGTGLVPVKRLLVALRRVQKGSLGSLGLTSAHIHRDDHVMTLRTTESPPVVWYQVPGLSDDKQVYNLRPSGRGRGWTV